MDALLGKLRKHSCFSMHTCPKKVQDFKAQQGQDTKHGIYAIQKKNTATKDFGNAEKPGTGPKDQGQKKCSVQQRGKTFFDRDKLA